MVNSVRGLCKANGVLLPKCSADSFPNHSDALPAGDQEMFAPRIRQLDGMIRRYAEEHFKEDVELLQTIPGVGPVTSACFVAAIPSADFFEDPRDAGAYFGLVPRQEQSGEMDRPRHARARFALRDTALAVRGGQPSHPIWKAAPPRGRGGGDWEVRLPSRAGRGSGSPGTARPTQGGRGVNGAGGDVDGEAGRISGGFRLTWRWASGRMRASEMERTWLPR